MVRLASCLLFAAITSAAAQPSTDRLVSQGTPVRWEAGAGGEWLLFTGDPSGSVFGLIGGLRIEMGESPAGFRLDGIWLHRSFTAIDTSGRAVGVNHQLAGAIVGMDVEMNFSREMSIGPTFGIGLAPLVNSSRRSTGNGTLFAIGASVRMGRLVLRQQAITVNSSTIEQFRTYFPLTVGWRF